MNAPRWTWHKFAELSPEALYAILELRSRIFVVEQNCIFPDMDGRDRDCEHLCGFEEAGDGRRGMGDGKDRKLVAYLRLVPPGVRTPEPSLGRVVVEQSARSKGFGRAVMLEGMRRCAELYPGKPVKVSAQQHLERFYNTLGFQTVGAPYLEDGIVHIDMICDGKVLGKLQT
jgi:ElaA protein